MEINNVQNTQFEKYTNSHTADNAKTNTACELIKSAFTFRRMKSIIFN